MVNTAEIPVIGIIGIKNNRPNITFQKYGHRLLGIAESLPYTYLITL